LWASQTDYIKLKYKHYSNCISYRQCGEKLAKNTDKNVRAASNLEVALNVVVKNQKQKKYE